MTILIVEDDEAITYVLKEYFKETRRTCISAPTVEWALRLLAGINPRAILLDFILGEEDAVPIIIKLREDGEYGACKVILMSACQDIEKISETYQIPHILKKPFCFEDLEQVIN